VAQATFNDRVGRAQNKTSPNTPTRAPRLYPVARRASLREHSLAPLQPDLGSPMLAQTSQVATVRRNCAETVLIKDTEASKLFCEIRCIAV
jgi:hypothetical protein